MMNESRDVHIPVGASPPSSRPDSGIYEAMGEAGIFRMLASFYEELEGSSIRGMFPEDMVTASERSAAFFVSVVGGPPLFAQRYGPPMMRARHMKFEIDEAARDVWLGCFLKTLEGADEKFGFPMEHMDGFVRFLREFSLWMVNKAGDGNGGGGGLGIVGA